MLIPMDFSEPQGLERCIDPQSHLRLTWFFFAKCSAKKLMTSLDTTAKDLRKLQLKHLKLIPLHWFFSQCSQISVFLTFPFSLGWTAFTRMLKPISRWYSPGIGVPCY
jgi:hypothetical protein